MSVHIRVFWGYVRGYGVSNTSHIEARYPHVEPPMPLTDTQVRHLKPRQKPYKVADGGGLYLHVTDKGSKLWRMRYRFKGREKLLAFGAYPDVSLLRAREKRQAARAFLADGIDPSAQAKADKAEQAARHEHTFANIADELMEKLRKIRT